jgi:hypothetical protein
MAREPSVVLGTMELKGRQNSGVDQDDLFKCVVLTSITAVAPVSERAAAQVGVLFVINVDQVAYLFVTTLGAGMEAPRSGQCSALYSVSMEDLVKLVASLAALLCQMRDAAYDRKAESLLLDLGKEKVESIGRLSSSAHPGPSGRPDKRTRFDFDRQSGASYDSCCCCRRSYLSLPRYTE